MSGRGAVSVLGDIVQHVAAGMEASCELSAAGFARESIDINVLSPSKVPVSYRLKEEGSEGGGLFTVAFKPTEVGTYVMDVYVSGQKLPESPVLFKVYNSALILVSELRNGVVGQPCQFRVDASQAGEGQLEISINDGEVPNHVQVLGGGRCLVHFTPEVAKPHVISIAFNGEPVPNSPFCLAVSDIGKVSVALHHLELMPVNRKAQFQIHVDTTDNAELAVSVTGPRKDIPVQVTGNVKEGFIAQFVPDEVGPYIIGVEYNNVPVGGTPFTGKAYDSSNVIVSPVPWGTIGKSLEFTVDASRAGEGNLEITISARGRNIPTQVHPQGSARFAVSFVPLEATDHVIAITFNKDLVPGAPFVAKIHTDPNRILVSGQSLAATAVGKLSYFTLSNVVGSADDLEIVIDSPTGEQIPAEIVDGDAEGTYRVEFCPRTAGEHQIYLSFASEPIPGSPFACKVYNVEAIAVRECEKGIVGKPVTFLVETSRAGPGNLEVTVNNGQVPTSAQAQGNHTYAISFIPKEAKPHIVELKGLVVLTIGALLVVTANSAVNAYRQLTTSFNGENVPKSPFKCVIVDAAKVNLSGDGLEKVPVGKPATFYIEGQLDMGDPEVKILAPTKRVLPSSIRFVGEGHFAVDYTPTLVGDHQVEVKMGDVQVQNSPFIVKAYDVAKVIVSNVTGGSVGKPVYFHIDASQAGAGNLEIIVSVNGKNVPNYVQSEGNAKFRVNFKPQEAGTFLLSVKFNNVNVPSSPFSCLVTGSRSLSVRGAGIQLCPVDHETSFVLEQLNEQNGVAENNQHALDVTIVAPSGLEVPFRLSKATAGGASAEVSYTPQEVGPHVVRVLQDGNPVDGSPFTCNVYDAGMIQVTGLPKNCALGKPVTFSVDASKAGEGTLELVVTTAKTSVRAEVQARSRGHYDVTFVPQEMLPHYINISFNEEHIRDSPLECVVVAASDGVSASDAVGQTRFWRVRGEGARSAIRGHVATLEAEASDLEAEDDGALAVKVHDATGATVAHDVAVIARNKYRIQYVAKAVGTHVVELSSGGKTRKDTLMVNVYDPSRVHILKSRAPYAGENNVLMVDTSAAGRGALSISIRAVGQEVRHNIRDLGQGRFEIAYMPELPTLHKVDVKYNGHPVANSPLELQVRDPLQGKLVTASGSGLYSARVGQDSSFTIDTMGKPSGDLDVVVTGPSDGVPPFEAIPVRCYQQKDGRLLADFRTTSAGVHKVEVMQAGKHIRGSPFECRSYNPDEVYLLDVPRSLSQVSGADVRFKVDRRRAGTAELDVIVTSPEGDDLPVDVKGLNGEEGMDLVEFTPTMAGKYRFVIRYGGVDVPDSPITFQVKDPDAAPVQQHQQQQAQNGELRAFGQGLQKAQINTAASFEIDAESGDEPLPEIVVLHPDSSAVKTKVERTGPASIRVTYVPDTVGVFHVQLRRASAAIVEYPVQVCNPRAFRIVRGYDTKASDFSPALERGTDSIVTLAVDAANAGAGKLEAELQLPSGDRIKTEVVVSKERADVRFSPYEPGEYSLSVKFNGFPLPFCPLKGRLTMDADDEDSVSAPTAASGQVKLTGVGLVKARVNEDNYFMIDGSKCSSGSPHASSRPRVSLSGAHMDVAVELRSVARDVYEASYSPKQPGNYMLNITWGGRLVNGCPLKIVADDDGGSQDSVPASRVFCSGEGLRSGVLGKDIRSFIDTRKAGPGELSLHCVGPRGKTAYCELNDHQDGTFTLNLKPQEAGKHQLSVQYGGVHVQGSPFSVRVSGAPDPEKVRVYGPGVEHGVLAMYQSRFICDTRGAGAGQLTVRIRGPKGAFRVEMQRESQKDRTILCKYEPTEPGDYRIEVKWCGENVPGSPFLVMIFDTQEELTRFLQGGYSPHSDMYGSIGGPFSSHYGAPPIHGHQQHPWGGSQLHIA